MTRSPRGLSITRLARRRGMIYIAVIGTSVIVMTLAGGALLVGRTRARSIDGTHQMADARLAAASGLELARLWIDQDVSWRTNRSSGTWATDLSLGGSKITIRVVDPIDGNLANRPHDPVVITAAATNGVARQVLQTTLVASATPLPALAYAVHGHTRVEVRAGKSLAIGTATASSSGEVKTKDAVLEGNAEAPLVGTNGIIWGTINTIAVAKAMPASTVPEMYAALGTPITGVTLLDKQVLGPGFASIGSATNPDGVYVIRSSSDVTLRNTHITGTLVVFAPKLTLDTAVLIEPHRADYPALIVSGDLNAQYNSATSITESLLGIVFNPLGALIDGASAGTYPNEVRGLVHVTGTVETNGAATFKGAILADTVTVKSSSKVVYDPALFTSPPQGYASRVRMLVDSNATRQTID